MKPIQIKKNKNIKFHKANFKNAQKITKFNSSNGLISLKMNTLSSHLNEQNNSHKSLDSGNTFKKIEKKFLIKKPSLFKNKKKLRSSNKLNCFEFKDFMVGEKSIYIKQKEERGNKLNKQMTQKVNKIKNNNKNGKKSHSCKAIDKIYRCKTFCNNNKNLKGQENGKDTNFNNKNKDKDNKVKTKDIKLNNQQTNNGEIINEELKEVGNKENFVNSIKRKLLCCIYL